ncbi:MAG: sulfur carrier protein ThiS [Marinifilaceae bacterium]|jgi:sulfur carrier protein|nr:sulfur carrier protein ThiS [Marinifilaceae bacterium]
MKVIINQKEKDICESMNIDELIKNERISNSGLAIAVNQNIIPKNKWALHLLKENDNIMIIRASHGG